MKQASPIPTRLFGIGVLILVLIVHWPALFFFFAADDLIHLQQAAGIIPTPHVPWRILSQVVYFRAMVALVGPWPLAFMAVNMALHVTNAVLVLRLTTRAGVSAANAILAALLFSVAPILVIVIGHAVIINDIAALTLTLLAMQLMSSSRPRAFALGVVAYAAALLCKESILLMPLLVLWPGLTQERRHPREMLPVVCLMVVAATALFIGRYVGGAPSGAAYELSAFAPFGNLMTYTAWFLRLDDALPDLVRSMSPVAWRLGLPTLLICCAAAALSRRERATITLGLAWWLLGLAPVLLFVNSAYPHYTYVGLPGLALAVAGTLSALARIAYRPFAGARGPTSLDTGKTGVVAAIILVVCYSAVSRGLVMKRVTARVPGIDLPLDPQLRSMVVAGRAVTSLARYPLPEHARLAIFSPPEQGRVFGARSGHEYERAVGRGYDLQRAALSDGRALRVFFPQIDDVAYVDHWSKELRGYVMATRFQTGEIVAYGSDLSSQVKLAQHFANTGAELSARGYLDSLISQYPSDSALRAARKSLP